MIQLWDKRVYQLYEQALDLNIRELPDFLNRLREPDLRKEVENLLDAAKTTIGIPPALPRLARKSMETLPLQIGNYPVLRLLGEGGMSFVFLALQPFSGHYVAIKQIKRELQRDLAMERLSVERQALSKLNHDYIVKIPDGGQTSKRRPYLVLEYVDGSPLTHYCRRLPLQEKLSLFVRVCEGVQHMHDRNVLHRDLKPGNILVTKTPEGSAIPKIIDFGIARVDSNESIETLYGASDNRDVGLVGSPCYMSPEQVMGCAGKIDHRTDIYSLGVLLYELLTGSLPLQPGRKLSLEERAQHILTVIPPKPSTRPGKVACRDWATRWLWRELDRVVMKAIDKSIDARYSSAADLAIDLRKIQAKNEDGSREGQVYRFISELGSRLGLTI